ncbi:WD40-repeat-containing domain protein [Paraphysoderma sedebokerense]|nr:WD40-repeat-containing domain protein [Paraphysoderma sedebokerense]
MNIHHFEQLMRIFQEHQSEDGEGGFDIDTVSFREVFGKVLGGNLNFDQMTQLFMKIDANSDGTVSWDEFSTFVMMGGIEQEVGKIVIDERIRKLVTSPHKDMIKRIDYIQKERKYMSISRDGTVCLWSPTLKIQRIISTKEASPGISWITDAVVMHDQNKVAIVTDDRQLSIYELTSIKARKLVTIGPLEYNPLCVAYIAKYDDEKSLILFGDDGGYVNFLSFTRRFFIDCVSDVEPTYITPATLAKKEDNIYKQNMSLNKKKIHDDWIEQIQIYRELNSFVSCSSESTKSMAIGGLDRKSVGYVRVPKGIRCFDFSRRPSFLITGGRDKTIRLWNPYVLSKCAGSLFGHNATITEITINQEEAHIISLSEDKVVKVWSIKDMTCLQTLTDKVPHRPENIISGMYFDALNRQLVTGSNKLELWPLYTHFKQESVVGSHDAPIVAAIFNHNFHQVVSGCQNSTVSVWDVGSGNKTFQFFNLHGKLEITAMCFDKSCRRLLTGSRDGVVKMWNFNNGQLLKKMVKSTRVEISAVLHVEISNTRLVIAVGWDRKVSIFMDSPEDDEEVTPIRELYDDGSGIQRGHQDDILAVCFAPPNILATGGIDGLIVVWNLESASLRTTLKEEFLEHRSPEDRAIEEMLFLYTGSESDLSDSEGLTAMCASPSSDYLIVGGSSGHIHVYAIKDFAILPIQNVIEETANLFSKHCVSKTMWKAHQKQVTSIDYVSTHDLILTASYDFTVRMWALDGSHVGIFGQEELWELGDISTYMPVPSDVRQEHSMRKNMEDTEQVQSIEETNQMRKYSKSVKALQQLETELIEKLNLYDQNGTEKSKTDKEKRLQETVVKKWKEFCRKKKLTKDWELSTQLLSYRHEKQFFTFNPHSPPKTTKSVKSNYITTNPRTHQPQLCVPVKSDAVFNALECHDLQDLSTVSFGRLEMEREGNGVGLGTVSESDMEIGGARLSSVLKL